MRKKVKFTVKNVDPVINGVYTLNDVRSANQTSATQTVITLNNPNNYGYNITLTHDDTGTDPVVREAFVNAILATPGAGVTLVYPTLSNGTKVEFTNISIY